MIDGIGSTGVVSAAVAAAAVGGARSVDVSHGGSALGGAIQNPRVVLDPAVGFITEYLSSNGGHVVFQSPSVITVAYLRQGLLSDGTPQQTEASYSALV